MRLLSMILLMTLLLAACGNQDAEEGSEAPSNAKLPADYVEETPAFGIVGEITEIEETDTVVILHIEGEVSDISMYDKVEVTITDETLITIAGEHGHSNELTVGMKVEVIFDGPVMESYPVRGTAKEVAEAKMR